MSWSIESMTELSTAYWKSCVLSAAIELRLFDVLGTGGTAEDVASRAGSATRHTEELLNALASLGVLEKDGATYRMAPDASSFLTSGSPTSLLDALRYNIDLYPLWGKLGSCVREGKPVLPPSAHLGEDPARTKRFVMGMHSRALSMAPALLPSLDLKPSRRLLDIGAGPGTFSRGLLERFPKLNVTLLDLDPVLNIARDIGRADAAIERLSYCPADYRKDAFPSGFDSALFCGALHQENPDTARNILRKINQSLVTGGRLFVVDMMLSADRSEPLFSILFSLNMRLINPFGRVFTADELSALLRETGFADIECLKPSGCPYWVVKAVKLA